MSGIGLRSTRVEMCISCSAIDTSAPELEQAYQLLLPYLAQEVGYRNVLIAPCQLLLSMTTMRT